MAWRDTDRFENWFITSLQTSINDTTNSFRINKVPNVHQGRLIIDPFNENEREIIYFDSHDGNLLTDVIRGDDHTEPQYHLEGTLVVMNITGADLNDLYADWDETVDELEQWKTDQEAELDQWLEDAQIQVDDAIEAMENQINGIVTDVETWVLDHMYPVGSIYLSVNDTNPSILFGGTWVAWGSGRVPVGVDTLQTEFDTVEETGGAKTHILTADEMPNHRHPVRGDARSDTVGFRFGSDGGSTANMAQAVSHINMATYTGRLFGWYVGGDQAHNNLQPYITCYMWKRTA